VPPAEPPLGRRPRSKLDLLKPELSRSGKRKQQKQKENHDGYTELKSFQVGDTVYVKDFPNGKDWLPGEVVKIQGPLSYHVQLTDGRTVRRLDDVIRKCTLNANGTGSDQEIPSPNSDTEQDADNLENSDRDDLSSTQTTPTMEFPCRSSRTQHPPD